jgi:hypothetical protein
MGGVTLGDLLTTFAEELMVPFSIATDIDDMRLRVKDMSIEIPAHLSVTAGRDDRPPRLFVRTSSPRDTSGAALGRIRVSIVTSLAS